MLHVNRYSLWFRVSTAVILLGPNASGEGEEQVAAFGGEAGPPHAAHRRAQALPGLPQATSTDPRDQLIDWDRSFISLEALAELPPPRLVVREV